MNWFTADLHLGDPNILRHTRRPWRSWQNMTGGLIRRYNERVAWDDQVFILGDLAAGTGEYIRWLVGRLNGFKTLILGNHDLVRPAEFWRNAGITAVYPHLDIQLGSRRVHMRHAPYSRQTMPPDVDWVLLGHIHNFRTPPAKHTCVCVEWTDYAPISQDRLKHLLFRAPLQITPPSVTLPLEHGPAAQHRTKGPT